ncbi:MAG TPA: 4Fe-4S binding protein [Planctomycetota bacterium]
MPPASPPASPPTVSAADCGRSTRQVPALRPSRNGRWRALALVLVHVLVALHVAHWMRAGETLSPLEPSEAMEFFKHDLVNAGFVFFGLTIFSTLLLGRWFCGWACHLVALQDLCLVLLKRVGIRPKPLRSRALGFVPALAALYMFVWPLAYRLWVGDAPGPYQVALTKQDFWGTFPPWPVALLTFAVCGFAIVYFLGAKGFCTYACPYGAFFGWADRLALGRIRVTDACEGCGHCTATCTSNVIVHEEVRTHGMVVDPGCMKCLDCVSVCPKEALYFGFGRPALGLAARAGQRAKASASWREEAVLALAFALAFLVYRGLYGMIPFLLALGLAGILAVCAGAGVALLARPSVRFLGAGLKEGGRLTRAGRIFAGVLALGLLVSLHSAWIQWSSRRAARAYDELREAREAFLTDPRLVLEPPARARAEGAAASARLALRFGALRPTEERVRLAWLELFAGSPEAFARELAAVSGDAADPAALHYDLARFHEARGRPAEAALELERSLAARASPAVFDRLARLRFGTGQAEEALATFERALQAFPDSADLHFNRGVVLGVLDRRAEALEAFRKVTELAPERLDALENLAGLLESLGRSEEARALAPRIEALRGPGPAR